MRLRTLAAVLLAGLISGCGHIKVDGRGKPLAVDVKLSSPSHFVGLVDGEPRCTLTSSAASVLKGEPGTCLLAGDDGVFRPCP